MGRYQRRLERGSKLERIGWHSHDVVPLPSTTLELKFGARIPAATFTSTNNVAGTFTLNRITLPSTAALAPTLTGNAFRWLATAAAITQNGTAAFNIENAIHIAAVTILTGTGTGHVSLNGALHGGGGLSKTGSSTFRLGSTANTFYGGVHLSAGTLTFNNDISTARVALRANAISFDSFATLSAVNELRFGELSGTGNVFARSLTGDGKNIVIFALGNAAYGGAISTAATGAYRAWRSDRPRHRDPDPDRLNDFF